MGELDSVFLSAPSRLAALRRYGVSGGFSEEAFERVATLAARVFDAPIAGVHFVDDRCRWAEAHVGHEAQTVDLDVSFSARGLGTEEVLVVEDAAEDPRFQDHPLVAGEPGVRFYAGAAITTPEGHALGRLCVLDTAPRLEGLSEHNQGTLCELAGVVMDELTHRAQPPPREEILESITDAFYTLDDEWRFTYVNQRAETLLECSRDEILGETIWDMFPETKELPNHEKYHRAVATGEPTQFEAYSPPFEAWFDVRAYPFDGGLSVYFRDVTERKEREKALREREEYLSVTLSSIGDAVLATDKNGDITEMNPVAERLTGWSHEEVEGHPLEDILHLHNTQTGEPVESPVNKVLREGKTVGLANHTVLTARDGTEYQIADSAAPIRTDEDASLGVVMVFRDVTEEYERREELREQRERLEMALIGGGAGMWDWDLKTGDAVYDERWAAILGYTLDEVEFENAFFERHVHPDDLERVYDNIERHARGEIPYLDQEIRMRHKDGSWRWVLDRGRIVERAEDGTPLRMVGTHVDITERKEAEQELQRSLERNRGILNTTIDGYLLYDGDGALHDVNPAYCEMVGYTRDELLAMNLTDLETQIPADTLLEDLRRYVDGEHETVGQKQFETKHRHKDGHLIDVEVSVGILTVGETPRVHAFVRDITERKEREQELRRVHRRFERFAENVQDALFLVPTDYSEVEYMNPAVERIYGVSADTLRENPEAWLTHVHPDDEERLLADIERQQAETIDWPIQQEFRVQHPERGRLWIESRLEIIEDDTPPSQIAGVATDITERKEAEQRLRLQLDTLRQVATGAPLETILQDLITAIEAQCPGMIGSVLFCDRGQERIRHGVAPNLPDAYNEAIDGVEIGPTAGSCGTAMHERAPVIAEDIESDSRWADYRDLARSHGLRACWSVPIFDSNDDVLGTFALYHEQPTAPTEKDRTLIDQARSLAGIAIERHRTSETLHSRERRVEALYDAMSTLAQSETPDELAEVLVNLITDTLGYPICAVRYAEDDRLVPAVVSPACREVLGPREAYAVDGPQAAAEAFRSGQTLHDDAAEAGVVDPSSQVKSVAYVPLGPYGTLSLAMTEANAISPFDVRLLDLLAQNAESVLRRIEHEQELVEAKETAEEMSRLKSAFLANISHEIRTPLTSILGFAEVIGEEVEGALDVQELDLSSLAQFSSLIERSGQRLMDTLTGVLNLSKLQTGEMNLSLGPVNLAAEARAAADEFTPQAEDAGVDLTVQGKERTVRAWADAGGVQIVLRNLLSNAIKYTEEGGEVCVRVRSEPATAAVLEVEDTGIGMDPEATDGLFEAFKQASEGIGREYEGTGLGLTVVKEVLGEMEGSIAVETEAGEGSRFTVRLPQADRTDQGQTGPEGANH
ncbi:PAS domain S-box protein [Salinibacter altiplanensis]|uniref:PAS domain S-box protein n=1 Tax=Salinibacter altiplanensis TaxID=1803181 RepID=UPI000C9FC210|nr:PAS domain S-box protein [Salinibacter altiplanensis]